MSELTAPVNGDNHKTAQADVKADSGVSATDEDTIEQVAGAAQRRCAGCARPVQDEAHFCPYCATPLRTEPTLASAPLVVAEAIAERNWRRRLWTRPSRVASLNDPSVLETSPVLVETPADPGRGGRRRWPFIAGATAVVIAVAASTVLLTRGGESYDIEAALVLTSTAVADPWEAAGRATTLEQLRAAGTDAAEAQTTIETELTAIEQVGDDETRGALRRLYEKELALLAVAAPLADLDESASATWPKIAADGRAAIEELDTAGKALAEESDAPVGDVVEIATQAVSPLEVTLTGMRDKLAAWSAEAKTVREDRDRQAADLEAYAAGFRAQIERYAGSRTRQRAMSTTWRTQPSPVTTRSSAPR